MKRRIVIILAMLLSISVLASDWEYTIIDTDFNGVFNVAYSLGGGSFPYKYPFLAVRNSTKNGLEILMTNVTEGDAYEEADILLKFDGGEILIYKAVCNKTGDTWFVHGIEAERLKLVNKILSSEVLKIRLSTKKRDDDFLFGLRGAKKAIDELNIIDD